MNSKIVSDAPTRRTGWGAVIQGAPDDLEDWEFALKPPFDPWVEKLILNNSQVFVLRTKLFETLGTALDVHEKAKYFIRILSGAVLLFEGAGTVRLGSTIELYSDGTMRENHHLYPESITTGRPRIGRPTLTAFDTGGKPVPASPPKASQVQLFAKLAQSDDYLEDALIFFSRGDNWFDIFKAIECLEDRFGGEVALANFRWISKDDLKRLKRTANSHRHHPRSQHKAPKKPVTPPEARQLLAQLIRHAFAHAQAEAPSQGE